MVGALSSAVTITIIEWAIRRESRGRLRPRVEDALYWIGLSFRGLVSAVAVDYAGTHLDSFKPLPGDASELFQHWLDGQGSEDSSRPSPLNQPMIVETGVEFRQSIERVRERDREVLESDLIRAMDEITRSVNFATWRARGDLGVPGEDPQIVAREASAGVVGAALQFTGVFRRYSSSWMEVMDLTREAAQAHSDQLRHLRDHGVAD